MVLNQKRWSVLPIGTLAGLVPSDFQEQIFETSNSGELKYQTV